MPRGPKGERRPAGVIEAETGNPSDDAPGSDSPSSGKEDA